MVGHNISLPGRGGGWTDLDSKLGLEPKESINNDGMKSLRRRTRLPASGTGVDPPKLERWPWSRVSGFTRCEPEALVLGVQISSAGAGRNPPVKSRAMGVADLRLCRAVISAAEFGGGRRRDPPGSAEPAFASAIGLGGYARTRRPAAMVVKLPELDFLRDGGGDDAEGPHGAIPVGAPTR